MGKAKDGSVTVDVVARLFDLTPRRIQQLVSEGVIPRGERGRYALIPCVQGYVRFLRSAAEQQQREVAALDPSDGAGRLKAAQASIAEIELERLRGTMVPVTEVEAEVGRILDALRAKLMAIPGKYGPMLVGCKTIAESTGRLEPAIQDAMLDLSRTGEEAGA